MAGIALRPLIVLEYMIVAFLAWIAGLVWVGTTGSMQMAVIQGTMCSTSSWWWCSVASA